MNTDQGSTYPTPQLEVKHAAENNFNNTYNTLCMQHNSLPTIDLQRMDISPKFLNAVTTVLQTIMDAPSKTIALQTLDTTDLDSSLQYPHAQIQRKQQAEAAFNNTYGALCSTYEALPKIELNTVSTNTNFLEKITIAFQEITHMSQASR